MKMFLQGATVKELKISEWEGKEYFSILLNGGLVSPKVKLTHEQFKKLKKDGIGHNSVLNIEFDVQYSDKTKCVHNGNKLVSYELV
ncbi:hypothetical protein NRK67_02485 [Fusobacteria bacterium ZRK30]|nr:hypothetical protein NRK67_02485 [Fusobacteria bacterium ZRK30]